MKTPEEMAEKWCAEHTCHLQMTCHANAFLAGYAAAQPKWISVKERLPENGQLVWTYSDDKQSSYGMMLRHGVWEVIRDGCELVEVTHWMPLPEPPKENE